VNIALVNEMKLLAMRMGIDIWEVIEAAKTKPFGFHAFYPGPAWRHCIPSIHSTLLGKRNSSTFNRTSSNWPEK